MPLLWCILSLDVTPLVINLGDVLTNLLRARTQLAAKPIWT
jgi:hypothetical protein